MRSNLSIIPSQLMNPWISKQWEEIAKKENKLYTTGHIDTEMDLEVDQPIWHQDPHTKKWNTETIHEELEEPHSYTIQDSAGHHYRWNRNWIKLRQVDKTDLSTATDLMGQEVTQLTCILLLKPASVALPHALQWMPCPLLNPPSCRILILPGEHLYLAHRHPDPGSLQESTSASHQGD